MKELSSSFKLFHNENYRLDNLIVEFYQMFKEEMSVLLKLFQKINEERAITKSFNESSIILRSNWTKKVQDRKLQNNISMIIKLKFVLKTPSIYPGVILGM